MIGENKVIATYIRTATDDTSAAEVCRTKIKEYIAELEFGNESLFITESEDIGCSGSNADKPELNELLEFVRMGNVDLVVTTDITRFNRNLAEAQKIIEEIEDHGAVVDFTDEPELLEEDGLFISN